MPSPPVPILSNRPLAPLTSWRIGGPAARYAEPTDPDELLFCLRWAAETHLPVFALGGGSNLLVADAGYPGLVLRYMGAEYRMETNGESARLRLGAHHSFAAAARRCAREGWAGLEWAEGIPGTIGGAVVGNAGAYGGEISACLHEVEVLSFSGGIESVPRAECGFAYRRSRFHGQDPTRVFLLAASVDVSRADPRSLEERIRKIARERRSRTPVGLSCGSVFRNPPGDSAGQLIESVGLKGNVCGGAQISPLHGNYILNHGGASARDVLSLIERARTRVFESTGIPLELEVRLIGFPPLELGSPQNPPLQNGST